MKKLLPIGLHDFKEIVEKDYYYIDKTLLIKDIWKIGKVVLATRPRRFGKTLNLSMLRYFFEKNDTTNEHLFTEKKIWQDESIRSLQGAYPVIFLTFKGVSYTNYENTYEKIAAVIAAEYERHIYLIKGDLLSSFEKEVFNRILEMRSSHVQLCDSIEYLIKLLNRYYNKKVIVLIDEYDVPVQRAYLYGFYDKIMDLIRPLLTAAFKDNALLEKGVITGILMIAKAGVFSGLNNLSVCTITDPDLADKFGFTQEEVENLLTHYDLSDKAEDIKAWYDSYTVGGGNHIYNPWSVLRCVDRNGVTAPYWVKTSDNELLVSMIAKASQSIKSNLELLLTHCTIDQKIEDSITFPELKTKTELMWSLLLYTGYLTYDRCIDKEGLKICSLKIPNEEIYYLYKNMITDIFNQSVVGENVNDLIKALFENNVDTLSELLQGFILTSMSTFDIPKTEPEKSYHLFVLGLLVNLKKTYDIRSNRESGTGRYDIMIIPKDKNNTGVIIEFKVAKQRSLEETAQEALVQIKEKKYEQELRSQGVASIIAYGIAFKGKDVFMLSEDLSTKQVF